MILRYYFDHGSGTCLWAADDDARALLGHAVDLERLGLTPETIALGRILIGQFNRGIGGSGQTEEPWSEFASQVDRFYERVVSELASSCLVLRGVAPYGEPSKSRKMPRLRVPALPYTYSLEEIAEIWDNLDATFSRERRAFQEVLAPGRPYPSAALAGRTGLWIDCVHQVAVPAPEVDGLVSIESTSLSRDRFREMELLARYGGRDGGQLSVREVLGWVGEMIRGSNQDWDLERGAYMFNRVIIQPLVNAAFEPLFWMVLARGVAESGGRHDVLADMAPLVFDMSDWPMSRAEARAVRLAQIGFVESWESGAAGEGAEAIADEEWARRCRALLDRSRSWVNHLVLDQAAWID
jgi:hypothetical protein